MTFRRSYGIPKKLWRSEGSHGIQETRTRLLFLSAPFEKTPHRADFRPLTGRAAVVRRAGKTRSSGRRAKRVPREICPPTKLCPSPAPVAAQAMLAAPHF